MGGHLYLWFTHEPISAARAQIMKITVTDTNLFAVAAIWFGDATAWSLIASVNGLSDPMIIGTLTIQLPPGSQSSLSSSAGSP